MFLDLRPTLAPFAMDSLFCVCRDALSNNVWAIAEAVIVYWDVNEKRKTDMPAEFVEKVGRFEVPPCLPLCVISILFFSHFFRSVDPKSPLTCWLSLPTNQFLNMFLSQGMTPVGSNL